MKLTTDDLQKTNKEIKVPHPDPQSNKSKWLEVQKEGFYIEIKVKMTKIYIKEESIEGIECRKIRRVERKREIERVWSDWSCTALKYFLFVLSYLSFLSV